MSKLIYSLLFVSFLVFLAACDESECETACNTLESPSATRTGPTPTHVDNAWVVCSKDDETKKYKPELFAPVPGGKPEAVAYQANILSSRQARDFDPSQYDCGTDPNSPPQPNSSHAVYPVGTPQGQTSHARTKPYSQIQNGGSYLAREILDLPFEPLGQQLSDAGACEASQPDILQVNHNNASVNRIASCPFSLVATIPVVALPLQIAVTPDGTKALVTSFNGAINYIDLATNKVSFTLTLPTGVNPNGIAITPDGTQAYITSFKPTNAQILEISLVSNTVIATLPASGMYPQSAFLSPDGRQVWITYPYAQRVDVIDTQTNTLITAFAAVAPFGVAFNSTGTRAYIADQAGPPGVVRVIDTNRFQPIATFTVGSGPVDIAVLYGDQLVVVNNNTDATVSLIDTLAGTVQTTPAGGSAPLGIAFVR